MKLVKNFIGNVVYILGQITKCFKENGER